MQDTNTTRPCTEVPSPERGSLASRRRYQVDMRRTSDRDLTEKGHRLIESVATAERAGRNVGRDKEGDTPSRRTHPPRRARRAGKRGDGRNRLQGSDRSGQAAVATHEGQFPL